ncbi:MAG: FAD-binding oxidoreductase [Bryobacteraceae bacterium]
MQDLQQPGSAAELAAVLAAAGEAGHRVELGGRFTKTRWGGPIGASDVRISTAKLNRVLEYEPRDLTISVEAGMPYAELTALLAANKQMIPLDPPYASTATVGGVLATNQSGPRRRLFGTARDLVIGVQFATMEGKLVQAGGMVVKNVAGLDMGKLMIGSWGTLAALTRVNFKLIPQDRARRTFLQTFSSAQHALAERNRILQSVLQPAAVDLLNPAATARIGHSGWLLAIGTGGSQALVDRYSRELPKAEALETDSERAFWHAVENFAETFLAEHPSGAMVRASTALQAMTAVVSAHNGPVVARAANGVAYLYHEISPRSLAKPEGSWPAPGAHVLMEAGPADRNPDTMWPEPGSDFPVMQKIKQMLDPRHLLNKGRLYGRI